MVFSVKHSHVKRKYTKNKNIKKKVKIFKYEK